MELFKLFGSILIDDQEAMKSISSVEKKIDGFGSKVEKFGKEGMKKFTAPIVGVGTFVAKKGMDFEEAMSGVGAVSGATAEQLKELEKSAREAGATTSKSATESANALEYMALAGWSIEEQQKGLLPILHLSEAGNLDLAKASDLVTDSLSAMGKGVDDLDTYLDLLAQTSRNSNTNIDQMAEAYIGVGGMLDLLNVQFEDSALGLGLMANAGIKGSEAGNMLSSMLATMTNPVGQTKKAFDELGFSMFDAQGNFKGIENGFLELMELLESKSPEDQARLMSQIAGKSGLKGFNAIMGGLKDDYSELKDAIHDTDGALDEMRETSLANMKGSLAELSSAIEEVALKMYEKLAPSMSKVVDWIKALVDKIDKLSPATLEMIMKIAGIIAIIFPLIALGGKLIRGVASIIGAVKKIISIIGLLTSPVGLVIVGIGLLIALIYQLWKHSEAIANWFKKLGTRISKWLKDVTASVGNFFKTIIEGVGNFMKGIWNKIKSGLNSISNAWKSGWNGVRNIMNRVWTLIVSDIPKQIGKLVGKIRAGFGRMKEAGKGLFNSMWEGMKGVWTSISTWVSEKTKWLGEKLAFWKKGKDEMDKPSPKGGGGGTSVNNVHGSKAKTQNVKHSGNVTVKGVNNKGQLVGVVSKTFGKKVKNDNRRLPNRPSIVPIG